MLLIVTDVDEAADWIPIIAPAVTLVEFVEMVLLLIVITELVVATLLIPVIPVDVPPVNWKLRF